MKKRELTKLALLGLSSGLLVANQLSAAPQNPKTQKNSSASTQNQDSSDDSDDNDGNLGYHLMNEDELLLELDPQGTKMYNSLDPAGKALAVKVASQRCNGTNECKGLNACQTAQNDCAGKGSCKGKSKCAFADKNLAVKVVYQKLMSDKRNRMMNGR